MIVFEDDGTDKYQFYPHDLQHLDKLQFYLSDERGRPFDELLQNRARTAPLNLTLGSAVAARRLMWKVRRMSKRGRFQKLDVLGVAGPVLGGGGVSGAVRSLEGRRATARPD